MQWQSQANRPYCSTGAWSHYSSLQSGAIIAHHQAIASLLGTAGCPREPEGANQKGRDWVIKGENTTLQAAIAESQNLSTKGWYTVVVELDNTLVTLVRNLGELNVWWQSRTPPTQEKYNYNAYIGM